MGAPITFDFTKEATNRARRPKGFFMSLVQAAQEAADWLLEAPEGTDQYERGLKLQQAIDDAIRK